MRSSNGLREGAPTKLELELPPAPSAPAQARQALEHLERVGSTTLNDARLVVTELVANSVRHAGLEGEDRIHLEIEDRPDLVRIAVGDPGPGFEPVVSDPDVGRASRRGLYLVEQVASEWGVSNDGLTTVWCEIERR